MSEKLLCPAGSETVCCSPLPLRSATHGSYPKQLPGPGPIPPGKPLLSAPTANETSLHPFVLLSIAQPLAGHLRLRPDPAWDPGKGRNPSCPYEISPAPPVTCAPSVHASAAASGRDGPSRRETRRRESCSEQKVPEPARS